MSEEPKLDFTNMLMGMPVNTLIRVADLALNRLSLRDLGEIGYETGCEFQLRFVDRNPDCSEKAKIEDAADTIEKALKGNGIKDEWAWVFEDTLKVLKEEKNDE